MTTLMIRNISDDVKHKLRQMAARQGHSMEEEVRQILKRAVHSESEKSIGSQIIAICAELNGIELDIPPRSLPRSTAGLFEQDA